jgi:hypothetical protein
MLKMTLRFGATDWEFVSELCSCMLKPTFLIS